LLVVFGSARRLVVGTLVGTCCLVVGTDNAAEFMVFIARFFGSGRPALRGTPGREPGGALFLDTAVATSVGKGFLDIPGRLPADFCTLLSLEIGSGRLADVFGTTLACREEAALLGSARLAPGITIFTSFGFGSAREAFGMAVWAGLAVGGADGLAKGLGADMVRVDHRIDQIQY